MATSFELGNIKIGSGEEPLIIPEIGINHGGNLEVAKLMADAAWRSGAKLVKHQTHIVKDEMSSAAKKVIPGNSKESIYNIMEHCALSEEDEYELKQYVEEKGMVFLSTPFSRAAADRLESFGVAGYKIGSGEFNNYPLIKHIASFGKPMILSTGMNDLSSVKTTVEILREYEAPFALLHTTNLYPTPASLVRLGAMQEMMRTFPDIPIGLSDHTVSNTACVAAMTLGAVIVERHFTDVKSRPGPDIICSMDEEECRELITASRELKQMLGGEKNSITEEQVTRDFAFASVVTIRPVRKGDTFSKENLWVKRPGTGGIPAGRYEEILGRTAGMDIADDTQLTWSMIK